MRYRPSETLLGLLTAALIALPVPVHGDSPDVTWIDPVEVAAGDAFQGPWRMNRSQFDFVDDPTVAINEEGIVAVAWADQSSKDIYLQIYGSDGQTRLDVPTNISRTPKVFSWLPRMVTSNGEPTSIYVLWQEIIFSGGSHGGEILFARSHDGGRTFNGPLNLSNSLAGDGKGRLTRRYWDNGSLDLVMGPDDTLYAAWTEYDGALWLSRSADKGETFSAPQRIAGIDEARPARGPSLAVDVDNVVYIAWTVGEDPRANIRIARSDDGGRSFGTPSIVRESSGHSDAPKIIVDRNRSVHLVYAESPAGPFDRYEIRYTRSIDGARTFESPRDISSGLSGKYQSSHFPAIESDGDGNLYVLWELFRDPKGRSLGLGFTISRVDTRSFPSPSLVPGTTDPTLGENGSRQGLLMRKLAVNRAGEIAVVNSRFKGGQASKIRLIRGRRSSR